MKQFLWSLTLIISLSAYAQNELDDLTKRIEALEKQQDDILIQGSDERGNQVTSFLNNKLIFGGFFEPAYTVISGPDTELQATNSSNILGINLASEYRRNLRFVSQFLVGLATPLQNEHNHPNDASGNKRREFGSFIFGSVLTQGYLEYSFNSRYQLQGGLGYVPFGHAFQQRELVLFVRRNGPQVLRTNELVAPLWSGLNFQAVLPMKNSSWGYNLYSFSPPNSTKHPGIGARTFLSSAQDKFTMGLSTQVGKIGAKNFQTMGTDLKVNLSPFILTTEYVHGFFEGEDPWSFYVEPAFYILNEEVLLYVFGDYSYNVRNRNGSAASPTSFGDPIQKYEYGFGVNWLPTSFTRIRAGLTFHDYVGNRARIDGQNRDYTSLDLSAGIAF